MYLEQINAYFNNPDVERALVAAISRLVSIRSVRGDALPGMPFGEGPAKALADALAISQEMGFSVRNYENYVGTADLNDMDTCLHILGHLDVVGEGTGWTITEPYSPKLVDGMLYGRGTDDDKGPIMAALFAMRAVRDLGIPLRRNVRLIFGTDEETGSSDLAYYYGREPYAPYTFTPDADFPVINIEKGSYKPTFSKTWTPTALTPRVTELHGGFRINVLPSDARAVVSGLSAPQVQPACDLVAAETGTSFALEEHGGDLHVSCHGAGAHAATPQDGNNAITALLQLLCALPLAPVESTEALHALHTLFPHGDCAGNALGIAQADDTSGALTLAFSLLELDEGGLSGRFDSRVPICCSDENCRKVAEMAFARFGFTVEGEMGAAHHTPANAPFVQTLLRCYEQYTGNKGACLAIGGGTYVHDIPGGVAFGCSMPGFSSNLHGADEHACVRDLITSCKIFAQAIADLCG